MGGKKKSQFWEEQKKSPGNSKCKWSYPVKVKKARIVNIRSKRENGMR